MIDVLVSTMNQSDDALIKQMNISSGAIVINQCGSDGRHALEYNGNRITWVDRSSKGLSKSRNEALMHSKASFCLIADDDMVYENDYIQKIQQALAHYKNADILVFQVEGIERTFKSYKDKPFKIGYLSSMKVASVQMVLKRESIIKNSIKFREEFGAGAKYKMGEENIFLFDCLKKGLTIQYVPVKIAEVHMGDSSWFDGFTKEYFYNRGACFAAMSPVWSSLFILQFAVRRRAKFKDGVDAREAILEMLKGRNDYLSSI